MPTLRRLSCFAISIAAALMTVATFAAQPSSWLELRKMDDAELKRIIEVSTGASATQRLRAILTIVDRDLNRSVPNATAWLAKADPLIKQPSREADYSQMLRCFLLHRQGLKSADEVCQPILDDPEQFGEPFLTAYRHQTRSYLLYRGGDHDAALEESKMALALAEGIRDDGLLATANNSIGVHHSTRLLPRMALPHLESAWIHAERMLYSEYKPVVQINLASVYGLLGRNKEAIEMLRSTLKSPAVTSYPTRLLVVQSLITMSKVELGEARAAADELLSAMQASSKSVLPDAQAFALTALGIAQLEQDQPELAVASFKAAVGAVGKTFENEMNHSRVRWVLVPYAKALRKMGRSDEAKTFLELVITTALSDQPNQLLVNAHQELAAALTALGDADGSLRESTKAAALEQQLRDTSFEYQIARLNASMALDNELLLAKEREIALKERAERETKFRNLSYLLALLILGTLYLFLSRRFQMSVARTERAANERLEGLVAQRTTELEEQMAERLRAETDRRELMQKLADGEKLRAMGQLTAGVAHDFNNLMTVVTLAAEYLRFDAGQRDELEQQCLDDILAAADSGAQITSRLLAYARKQPLKPKEIQLDTFLQDASQIFRNTLGERFELFTEFEPCRVLVDQGQLTTSLLNLVLNAKESMANRGIVSISLICHDDIAEIVVRDSGAGMDEEALKRAYEPFFTTKSSGEGTGLGLSMVFGFARQSGGDLKLESKLGEGTVARLQLPLASHQVTEPSRVLEPERPLPKNLDVLVVEDRSTLLEMLRRSLAQLGMRVSTASSAEEALEHIDRRGVPQLLISDIMMPGELDGKDLAAQLRHGHPNLPILLISGYTDSVDSEYSFLHKPFSTEELFNAIVDALRENQGRSALATPAIAPT